MVSIANRAFGSAPAFALTMAFVERQTNLWKRYWGWELVWLVYGVVNTVAITLIAGGAGFAVSATMLKPAALGSMTGDAAGMDKQGDDGEEVEKSKSDKRGAGSENNAISSTTDKRLFVPIPSPPSASL